MDTPSAPGSGQGREEVNVHIHFRYLSEPWGGSNSFLKTLSRYLSQRSDVNLVESIHMPHDILLIASWSTGEKDIPVDRIKNIKRYGTTSWLRSLFQSKRKPPRILHRIDGLGSLYGRSDTQADKLLFGINRFSDRTIFQSRFSQKQFDDHGYALSPSHIIPNGVDTQIFHFRNRSAWDGKRPMVLGAASWSKNPRKGHALIAQFSKLPNVKVRFIGNWAEGVPSERVQLLPPQPSEKLAEFYRSCDAFLFTAENEACPNTVIEAIASGLPCLYHDSGGTPELAAPYGMPINPNDLPRTLQEFQDRYKTFVQQIQAHAGDRLSIERAGNAYMSFFRECL